MTSPGKRWLSSEQIARLVESYVLGEKVIAIAAEFGVDESTVRRIVRKAMVPPRSYCRPVMYKELME